MQDTKWIEQVSDHEGKQCKWARVWWNVQNITEDIDQQVSAPDDSKETSNLHYTHTHTHRETQNINNTYTHINSSSQQAHRSREATSTDLDTTFILLHSISDGKIDSNPFARPNRFD